MIEKIAHARSLRAFVPAAIALAAPVASAHGAHAEVPTVLHGLAHLAPGIAAFGSIGLIALVVAIRARRDSRD